MGQGIIQMERRHRMAAAPPPTWQPVEIGGLQ
jgi:hypothetical protein